MSRSTGRNDPCPCGSGKKYKKCCLAKEQPRRSASLEVVPRALGWLEKKYPDALPRAVLEQFCLELDDREMEAIFELAPEYSEMFQINGMEWVLAEGWLPGSEPDEDGLPSFFIDLLLGPGGPLLAVEDRAYLKQMQIAQLDLYEVIEVDPGEGFTLRSMLWDIEPIWVHERTASREVEKGTLFAARILRLDPAILSGALYTFTSPVEFSLLRELQDNRLDDPAAELSRIMRTIVRTWLKSLTGEFPSLVDASTGDPLLLTHVHYRILDWPQLEERLNSHPHLIKFNLTEDANAKSEIEWGLPQHHLSGLSEDENRLACQISRRSEDRLVLFARTSNLADRTSEFLEALAGETLQHLRRELESPISRARNGGDPERSPQLGNVLADMTREDRSAFVSQQLKSIYASWADEAVPAFQFRTPRELVESPSGQEEVERLLLYYQRGENKNAREQDREPLSFKFLADELGMDSSFLDDLLE